MRTGLRVVVAALWLCLFGQAVQKGAAQEWAIGRRSGGIPRARFQEPSRVASLYFGFVDVMPTSQAAKRTHLPLHRKSIARDSSGRNPRFVRRTGRIQIFHRG